MDELKIDNTKLKEDFLNFISDMESCISRSQNFLSDEYVVVLRCGEGV